ncbi:MAG: LysR family transcriptional regulator [Pseudomonadota bacterium]|nr:LysR family transcriptional regulator [Pseudomonadota bacterium]
MVQKRSTDQSWDDLAAILAVARARSIRKAADALGVAHTTLARRVESAEASLGIVAFIRSVQGYALTEAGQAVVAHVERMADEAESLHRSVAGGDVSPRGIVRVTLPAPVLTYCLMEKLPKFHRQFPLIDLDFDTQYGFSDLDRHEADIAIRYQRSPQEHLVGTCVGASHEYAYASEALLNKFRAGEAVGLIGWSRSAAFLKRASVFGLGEHRIQHVCEDVHGQVALAENGLGIAILHNMVGDGSKILRRLFPKTYRPTNPIWVLSHPDLRRSFRVRTVSAFLIETLKGLLEERNTIAK